MAINVPLLLPNFVESYAEIISNGLENALEEQLLYEQSVTQDNNINNSGT